MRRIQVLSFLLLFTVFEASLRAEDNAPSQNAEAQRGFAEPSAGEKARRQKAIEYMRLGKKVILQWQRVPLATHYTVEVSNSPYFGRIVFRDNVTEPSTETAPLQPGKYYYQVSAFSQHGELKKLPIENFEVESPESILDTVYNVGSSRKKPTRVVLISPKEKQLFPLESRIRLSWTPHQSARSYQVRLWFVENTVPEATVPWHSHSSHPIWTTEVQNPWLLLRDVPYSSFISLKPGRYRWDVSAIHRKTGDPGEPSIGHFEISELPADYVPQSILKPIFRVDPLFLYQSYSSVTGLRVEDRYLLLNAGVQTTFWTSPHWGVDAQAMLSTFTARFSNTSGTPATSVAFFQTDFNMLYRTGFSPYPDEWRLTTGLGLGLHEFPQIDKVLSFNKSVSVARPKSLGLTSILQLHHAVSRTKLFITRFRLLVPLASLSLPAESTTNLSPNISTYLGFQERRDCNWCFGGGLFLQYRSMEFVPKPEAVTRQVVFPNQKSFVRFLGLGLEGSLSHRF